MAGTLYIIGIVAKVMSFFVIAIQINIFFIFTIVFDHQGMLGADGHLTIVNRPASRHHQHACQDENSLISYYL